MRRHTRHAKYAAPTLSTRLIGSFPAPSRAVTVRCATAAVPATTLAPSPARPGLSPSSSGFGHAHPEQWLVPSGSTQSQRGQAHPCPAAGVAAVPHASHSLTLASFTSVQALHCHIASLCSALFRAARLALAPASVVRAPCCGRAGAKFEMRDIRPPRPWTWPPLPARSPQPPARWARGSPTRASSYTLSGCSRPGAATATGRGGRCRMQSKSNCPPKRPRGQSLWTCRTAAGHSAGPPAPRTQLLRVMSSFLGQSAAGQAPVSEAQFRKRQCPADSTGSAVRELVLRPGARQLAAPRARLGAWRRGRGSDGWLGGLLCGCLAWGRGSRAHVRGRATAARP